MNPKLSENIFKIEDKKVYIVYEDNLLFLKDTEDGLSLPGAKEIGFSGKGDWFKISENIVAVSKEDIKVKEEKLIGVSLRDVLSSCDSDGYRILSRGVELLNWSCLYRHCPKDGHKLQPSIGISKRCDFCGREYFPTLFPAIVVLVLKGDEALLVQAYNFRNDIMALVAGFVECGENLEECVRREVKEETGLEISEIKYYGSQSWPFPMQMMVGFTAKYEGGELKFEDGEIRKGGFFPRSNPPEIPGPPSLSHKIIEEWLSGNL